LFTTKPLRLPFTAYGYNTEIPIWKQIMIARKRKTLIVCRYCHTAIHAGQPTRTRGSQGAIIKGV
jgi:hypothetical protein